MAMSERIRILLVKRDNFSEKELEQIAEVLYCDLNSSFTLRNSGEVI